jgi:hypothetical protein
MAHEMYGIYRVYARKELQKTHIWILSLAHFTEQNILQFHSEFTLLPNIYSPAFHFGCGILRS